MRVVVDVTLADLGFVIGVVAGHDVCDHAHAFDVVAERDVTDGFLHGMDSLVKCSLDRCKRKGRTRT